MTSFASGRKAEQKAANYLRANGYVIVQQNWRTRYCEIDIVASRQKIMYFVEVKYRASDNWGAGLEYITAQKLWQMQFAARLWQQTHGWLGECRLIGFEVSGNEFNRGRVVLL